MYGHEGNVPQPQPKQKFINPDCEDCNKTRQALMENAVCGIPEVECTHVVSPPTDVAFM